MPVYAVSMQKTHPFHGGSEDIGNTYHYDYEGTQPPEDGAIQALVNIISSWESTVLPDTVEFEAATVWGPTDGPEVENVIIGNFTPESTTTGAVAAPQGASQTTCAVFVGWPLPRTEPLNRKRRLGKYIRPAYGAVNDDGALSGRTRIPQSAQDFIRENYADQAVESGDGGSGNWFLCTSDGVRPFGRAYVKNYVTNRQITD